MGLLGEGGSLPAQKSLAPLRPISRKPSPIFRSKRSISDYEVR
jgi:hypothetical protein